MKTNKLAIILTFVVLMIANISCSSSKKQEGENDGTLTGELIIFQLKYHHSHLLAS